LVLTFLKIKNALKLANLKKFLARNPSAPSEEGGGAENWEENGKERRFASYTRS